LRLGIYINYCYDTLRADPSHLGCAKCETSVQYLTFTVENERFNEPMGA